MNKCNLCGYGFSLFKPELKCWSKGCKVSYHEKCYEKQNQLSTCNQCKTIYCEEHQDTHGCNKIAQEDIIENYEVTELPELPDLPELPPLNIPVTEEDKDGTENAVLSPNKTLIALTPDTIEEQLKLMEECEENGYELLESTVNAATIFYRKKVN